jgi:predicted transposase/invertase (TIGR01784 family)
MEKARINTNKVDRRRARLQAIQEKKAELKKQVFFDPTMDSTFKKIFKKIANLIHFLNAILHLEGNQQIVHVEKLKPTVRLAAPAKKPKIIRFDIHALTANGEYIDVEMQRAVQEDFLDRMELYSTMLSVNAKIAQISKATKNQLKKHPYFMPTIYSIWICCFNVDFCDSYRDDLALYRASDIGKSNALPIYPKKRYIVIDLTKYVPKKDDSPENEWIKLFKTMRFAKRAPKCKDEIIAEIYECMRISNSTDRFITKVAENMIDRDEYNASMSYASRVGLEKGLAEGEARGVAKMKKKFASRDKKIAKYLRSIGVSSKHIATALATK